MESTSLRNGEIQMSGTISTQWFFSDWMSDAGIRLSSLAARGLWKDLLCIAAANKEKDYGFVLINNKKPTPEIMARLVGSTVKEIKPLLAELEQNGVFSRDRRGVIYCRRMVRSQRNRMNGRLGGNPNLLKSNEKQNPDIHPLVLDMVMVPAMESESTSRKKKEQKLKSTLPVDWKPSADLMDYGRRRGFADQQILDIAEDMRTWADENAETSKGQKKNWNRTFEGFLRRTKPNGGNYGPGRPRAFQDDSRSISRAAQKLADKAARGEFSFGPRPTGRPDESEANIFLLSKGRS